MMTKEEMRARVLKEITEYRYVRPSDTLGVPVSQREMDAEVLDLKRNLREPGRVDFVDGGSRWIVTQTDRNGYFVFFDEVSGDFGLGCMNAEGGAEDINVHGDLVGTYAAK